jgi:hypothetical protein
MRKAIGRTAVICSAVLSLSACSANRFSPQQAAAVAVPTDTAIFTGNPIIRDKFTADPAALVYNNTVYLYAGQDEAPEKHIGYVMNNWLCYSSTDMVAWTEHPVPLKAKDFSWAKGEAWASHVVEKGGKFYWYATVEHRTVPGKAIGVAVADKPTGPFKDAIGKALITNDMTTDTKIFWDDIDPAVFIDDDGIAYLFWGNTKLRYARLKANMIELDGPVKNIDVPMFTEASYVHKRNGWYYLTYALGFPERTVYAMSRNIDGPGNTKAC